MKFYTLEDFSGVTGVGISVIDRSGDEQFCTPLYSGAQECLDYVAKLLNVRGKCKNAMRQSGEFAHNYGNRYVFLDPRSFVFFASPIFLRGEHHLTAVGGPVLMKSHKDYIDMDIDGRAPDYDRQELTKILAAVPVVKPNMVNSLSEQLFVNSMHLSDNVRIEATDAAVAKLREFFDKGGHDAPRQGYANERRLVNTLSIMDNAPARVILNEIVGHILFHSGKNVEFVKIRAVELIGILSTAALRSGDDAKAITDITYNYSKRIHDIDNMKSIVSWLNDMLGEFSILSLNNPSGKHASALCDTINYINRNYNRRLDVDLLANRIYLSSSHFSTLFKAETGCGFKEYLNKVRIEQSKILMQNPAVSLADIASMVGYTDQSYFTRVFKKLEGKSPNHYRGCVMKKARAAYD